MQRVKNELVHGARIPEAHFDLGRMYVHVHELRLDLDEEGVGGLARVMHHIGIRLADRVADHLVAHEAPVHEEVLGGSSAGGRRQRDPAREREDARTLRERQRVRGEVIAQHGAHACRRLLRRERPVRAGIVL